MAFILGSVGRQRRFSALGSREPSYVWRSSPAEWRGKGSRSESGKDGDPPGGKPWKESVRLRLSVGCEPAGRGAVGSGATGWLEKAEGEQVWGCHNVGRA